MACEIPVAVKSQVDAKLLNTVYLLYLLTLPAHSRPWAKSWGLSYDLPSSHTLSPSRTTRTRVAWWCNRSGVSLTIKRPRVQLQIETRLRNDWANCSHPGARLRFEVGMEARAIKCLHMCKGKGFPYSLPSVWPGADPGVQSVSLQVTISHPPGGRLPLLFARPAVTFPAAEYHRPLAGTKLYCLVTEAHRCEQLAQGCCAALPRVGFEPATCWSQVQRSARYHPSVLLHCWLGYLTCKIVSEKPYHTIPSARCATALPLYLWVGAYNISSVSLGITN